MASISVENAQAHLSDVIRRLTPGQELTITENEQPVAKLVAISPPQAQKIPRLGTLRGTVLSMEHFDDPLEEFEEYM